MDRRALGDEPGAGCIGRDIVVLVVAERLDFIRARLNGRAFQVRRGVLIPGFDETHMIEQKFVAACDAELAFFEEHADFRRGAVVVIRQDFHDDRHLVRRIAFKGEVLQHQFFAAGACAFFDRALDVVAGHALASRFFHRSEKACIAGGIRPARLGGDGDFLEELAARLRFPE